MASLKSVCELAWLQLNPIANDEVAISKEEFIETGRSQYAWEVWRLSKEEKRENGGFNVPSNLLTEVDLDVVDNQIDVKDLDILRSLPNDTWLVNIGGLLSPCKYIASNVNLTQLLEDDDSIDEDMKPYLVVGNKIKFPKGAHTTQVSIIYANNGMGINDEEVEIDDMLAAIIRTKLLDIYGNRGQVDSTNNSNPDN